MNKEFLKREHSFKRLLKKESVTFKPLQLVSFDKLTSELTLFKLESFTQNIWST